MDERLQAEGIAESVRSGSASRILVRNAVDPAGLSRQLEFLLADKRVLVFSGGSSDPVRETLLDYFTGHDSSDPLFGFEAGWRSHLTELSLVSPDGMEQAAGLSSLRDSFRAYLSGEERKSSVVEAVLSSFAVILPTVFIFSDPSSDDEVPECPLPPSVIISSGNLETSSDLFIDVSSLSMDTSGKLVSALQEEFGTTASNLKKALKEVFVKNDSFRSFVQTASLLNPSFHPEEAAGSCRLDEWRSLLQKARRTGMLSGFLVCSFPSGTVRRAVEETIPDSERKALCSAAAGSVISFRGRKPAALGKAAAILAEGGFDSQAADLFAEAADGEKIQERRSSFYLAASMLDCSDSEERTFKAALGLYRNGQLEEASRLLTAQVLERVRGASVLKAFCSSVYDDSVLKEATLEELDTRILKAKKMFDRGNHSRAEELLLSLALFRGKTGAAALAELGEQYWSRGLYHRAVCIMRAALSEACNLEMSWLEIRARFTIIRSCNRAGRFNDVRIGTELLMQRLLENGDTAKLVILLNCMGNTLLLTGRKEQAAMVYTGALKIIKQHKLHGIAAVLNNLSVAQRKMLKMDEALESLMKLIRECVSRGEPGAAAIAYGNMARLFIDLSRFDSASDCLESMVEFSQISGNNLEESICYISALLAFQQNQIAESMQLLDRAAEISRKGGSRRRLSTNLLKKGSLLLRVGRVSEAVPVLQEAISESEASGTRLNHFIAAMKLAAAKAASGTGEAAELLAVKHEKGMDDNHRGELYYWHWKHTGSRQSMTACAQLLSKGLSNGLHHCSYLYMLHEIVAELPSALAASLPLVHNYPSP
ncbi:hypothetical protein CSA37_08210 [Candidatus Fermentibacteria bacterium]|nr:MAG: hypothetical protein CSA37_08210 [Candidatus Fermentibacteria bacterium]